MSSLFLNSAASLSTFYTSAKHSSVSPNRSSFLNLVILWSLICATDHHSLLWNESSSNSSHPQPNTAGPSSSPRDFPEGSLHPTRTDDLPIQWTEQDKVPFAWKGTVHPLIFASLSPTSPKEDHLRLSLPFEISRPFFPFMKLELTLRAHRENHSSMSNNPFPVDFVSPHFVFAEHLEVHKNGELFTDAQNLDENAFGGARGNEWFKRLFPDDPLRQEKSLEETCQFFTGRIDAPNGKTAQKEIVTSGVGVNPLYHFSWRHQQHPTSNVDIDNSGATFSLCSHGKLNGIITWQDHGHFMVEPLATKCRAQFRPSISNLTSNSNAQNSTVLHACPHRVHFMPFPNWTTNSFETSTNGRAKRSVSLPRTIEIMVVTDLSMWKNHGESLQDYVFALMASVSHIFKHSSIGNQINVKLIKLYAMKNTAEDQQQEQHFLGGSAQSTLRRFCHWQYAHNKADDADPKHYDIAILLTRRDLCRKSSVNQPQSRASCDTIGLAHSGQICDPTSSCAIVEDTGLSAAFTIAHELGHVLGIPHDDEEKCRRFYDKHNHKKETNVMARMIDVKSHMWSWSACSRHFITEYLDSGSGNCLLDDNARDISIPHNREMADEQFHPSTYTLRSLRHQWSSEPFRFKHPGEYYTATAQCQLMYGKSSQVCTDMPECSRLWCTHSGPGCKTSHTPWADGTVCSQSDTGDKWCQQGHCVPKNVSLMKPLDGGWGDWSPYSQCSMQCGGGISQAKRNCDKPSPRNGGKFCLGERVLYKSCNIHQCDPPIGDIRANQCSEFNGKQVIKNMEPTAVWVTYHTRNLVDMCKLHCSDKKTGNYYQLKEKVLDGTPCSPDSYDICVNGKCLSAGCDRILGSNVTLDQCGVCGGDNSTCRQISQRLPPRTGKHGYNAVAQIPAGSSNILVYKNESQQKENWLVIRADDGSYLLNGGWTVNVYERKWHYGGATIEYSGVTSSNQERINASRPIDRAIFIEILCVGELQIPEINYSYMVSLESSRSRTLYRWSISAWSRCDQQCQGKQERRALCTFSRAIEGRKYRKEVVHSDYCRDELPPPLEARACNLHCDFEWRIEPIGSCTEKCGPGVQYLSVKCVKKTMRNVQFVADKYCAKRGSKPMETEPCNVKECINYQWKFSEWSSCSPFNSDLECGDGNQTREARCISSRVILPDREAVETTSISEECAHLEVPVTSKLCPKCPEWRLTEWSQCSVSCGHGEKTRIVLCNQGDNLVDDAYCLKLTVLKPEERSPCYTECQEKLYLPEVENTANNIDAPHESTGESSTFSSRVRPLSSLSLTSNADSIELPDKLSPAIDNSLTDSSSSDDSFSNETIVWRIGSWTQCQCEHTLKRYVLKRLVRCIRHLPDYADNQEIPDEFCLRLSRSPKPPQEEQCSPTSESFSTDCSLPVGKQKSAIKQTSHSNTEPTLSVSPSYLASLTLAPTITPSLPSLITSHPILSTTQRPSLHRQTGPPSISLGIFSSTYTSTYQTSPASLILNSKPISVSLSPLSNQAELMPVQRSSTASYWPSTSSSVAVPSNVALPTSELPLAYKSNHLFRQWNQWSEWSPCTVLNGTCGDGIESREALCPTGGKCQLELKPLNETRRCHKFCPFHEWHYKEWSPCSETCGQGERTRSGECRDWTNITVSDYFCDSKTKLPTLTEACQVGDCNLVWHTGHWSECSQSCDAGIQERSVTCHRRNRYGFIDTRPLPDFPFSLSRRKRGRHGQSQLENGRSRRHGRSTISPRVGRPFPSSARHRKRHNNEINYNYKESASLNGRHTHGQWCNLSSKPTERKPCNLGPCISAGMTESYVWRPSPWQPCDRSCGDGKQVRKIICQSVRTGSRASNSHCNGKLRPERKRTCNLRDCGVTSCLDMRDRSQTREDGEYQLSTGQGVFLRVYCYGMGTLTHPREYLILDSAVYEENYSQLLHRPSDCSTAQFNVIPSRGVELERLSRMYFKYVRLNMTSLSIIASDTMFAEIKEVHSLSNILAAGEPTQKVLINERSLGFGQALVQGCSMYVHNSIRCNFGADASVQSRFSINLENTGLAVAPESHWHRLGPEQFTQRNIKRSKGGQKVEGNCGLDSTVHSLTSRNCQVGCQPFAGAIPLIVF